MAHGGQVGEQSSPAWRATGWPRQRQNPLELSRRRRSPHDCPPTPYKCYVLGDAKSATHNLPHSSAGVARKPILREIGLKPHAKGESECSPPSSYAKVLDIRLNVGFKAYMTGGHLRRRQKRSISQMAEADPLCHCLSAICFFGSRGPRRLQRRFPFLLVPSGRVLYPRPTPSRPCRSLAALLVCPGSSGRRPRPKLLRWGPFCLPFQSPLGLTSCRLLALIDSPAPRFSVEGAEV
jgi:hypothetical protein